MGRLSGTEVLLVKKSEGEEAALFGVAFFLVLKFSTIRVAQWCFPYFPNTIKSGY